MTGLDILIEIRRLGGQIEARGDKLHVDVPVGVLTTELKAELAKRKPELLACLSTAKSAWNLSVSSADSWVWIEERSAIMEIDGGLSRNEADALAFALWFQTFIGGMKP